MELWRSEWGDEGRYTEAGLCITADRGVDDYVVKSLTNVKALLTQEAELKGLDPTKYIEDSIKVLQTRQDILDTTKTGGGNGDFGYLNRRAGWADAEASMRWLRRQVESTKRVSFVKGTVKRLSFAENGNILGATLSDRGILHADLTVIAAGAWSAALLDLRGIVQATGQVLTYIELSDEEAAELSKTPTQLNMSTGMTKHAGCFCIAPPHPTKKLSFAGNDHRLFWKMARHGYGYLNIITIPHPEDSTKPDIAISAPRTSTSTSMANQKIPQEAIVACTEYLQSVVAPDSPLLRRPFVYTRICHYADTASGDWLIDYHPKYNNTLFVATGGSGHGFKFLPVIGDQIVKCILGRCPEEFKTKWCWRDAVPYESWPGDGSRGGRRGMILDEELAAGG